MNIKSQAISGVKWTSFSSLVVLVAQMIQLLVLSRILSAHDFGLWAVVNLVIFYTTIFSDLGISAAVIHFQKTSSNQLSTLYWANIFSSIFLFVIIWIFAPLILSIFNETEQVALLLTSAVSLPFSASGILFQNLFQKELQFNFLSKVEISSAISGVIVSISLAISGFGVWAFIFGQLTNISIKSLMLTIKGWKNYKIRLYFNLKEVKKYLKFGGFQIGERSVNIFNQRLDQIIIGTFISVEALGYYNFAFNLISRPITFLNPIFVKVAFPLFAKLQNDKILLKKAYLKLIRIISLASSVIYVLIFITAPIAVPVIFGEKWNDSIILMQVLSGVSFMRSIGNPVGSLSLAMGRADLGLKWNAFLLVIFIPMLYYSVLFGGALGITLGLLITEVVMFYPGYKYLIKPFLGNVFSEYFIQIVKPLAISLVMFLVFFFQFIFPLQNQIIVLIIQVFYI